MTTLESYRARSRCFSSSCLCLLLACLAYQQVFMILFRFCAYRHHLAQLLACRRLYSNSSTSSSSNNLPARNRFVKPRHRLFFAGLNPFLPSTVRTAISPSFSEVPLSEWLGSLGIDSKNAQSEITHIAAGHGHTLIAFRNADSVESVFAIGRNESGQLGIGYNS